MFLVSTQGVAKLEDKAQPASVCPPWPPLGLSKLLSCEESSWVWRGSGV